MSWGRRTVIVLCPLCYCQDGPWMDPLERQPTYEAEPHESPMTPTTISGVVALGPKAEQIEETRIQYHCARCGFRETHARFIA